jgi:type II secretory pathway component PulM
VPPRLQVENRAHRPLPRSTECRSMKATKQSSTLADIKDFTRATVGDWLARMSGPLSVPAAALAYWVPNDTAKILLGLTAFICLWVTAYRVWKPEHDKVVERDQRKRQLLDEISAQRQTMVGYRIDMEADVKAIRFDPKAWQQKYDALEKQIAAKIEQLSSKAEAITFRNRGNIPRAINTDPNRGSGFIWPVLVDTCIYDLDYLKTFIQDYSRGRERRV